MVEEKKQSTYICSNCSSKNTQQELDNIFICMDCSHKFNTNNTTSFSYKFFFLALAFLSVLFGLMINIQPFNQEEAMQTFYETLNDNSTTQPTNKQQESKSLKKIISANTHDVWVCNIDFNKQLILEQIDIQTKLIKQKIYINDIIVENYEEVFTTLINNKIIILYDNLLYIVDINTKQISLDNNKITEQFTALNKAILKLKYIAYLNAIHIVDIDGQAFYYLIQDDKLLSEETLKNLQKNENIQQKWNFVNQYIITNAQLFKIIKKEQNYMMPVTSKDIEQIFEGSHWLKNTYKITQITKVNIPFSLSNQATILAQNTNEIIIYQTADAKLIYYDIANNIFWTKTLDIKNYDNIKANINGDIVVHDISQVIILSKKKGDIKHQYLIL